MKNGSNYLPWASANNFHGTNKNQNAKFICFPRLELIFSNTNFKEIVSFYLVQIFCFQFVQNWLASNWK